MAGSIKDQPGDIVALAIGIDLLTVVAMFVRNLFILAIFARPAVITAAGPLAAMIAAAGICLWLQRKKGQSNVGSIHLSSPLSLRKVFRFGFIFIAIQVLGSLGQMYLGHFGFCW